MSEIFVAMEKQIKALQASQVKPYSNGELYNSRNCADCAKKIVELLSYETRNTEEALNALTIASLIIEQTSKKRYK